MNVISLNREMQNPKISPMGERNRLANRTKRPVIAQRRHVCVPSDGDVHRKTLMMPRPHPVLDIGLRRNPLAAGIGAPASPGTRLWKLGHGNGKGFLEFSRGVPRLGRRDRR
jgi:hypothetical protein